MNNTIRLKLPCTSESLENLKAGMEVLVSGTLYTARDQAHMRIISDLEKNIDLAFELKGAGIYYCGPTPTRPGQVVGSIGPTTSYRMDDITIPLLEQGMKVMIGKGNRNKVIEEAIKDYKAIYLCAIGGAGALYANCIKSCKVIAYEDLGAEAVHKLEVEDFPVVVAIDVNGNKINV
ncbi:MAG: FumA C-terminus/TtdB family hydratase beta subunit [Filifactoraceae bacterium]